MFTRLICALAAVAVLATGAQAQRSQGVKTFPQTKPGVYVKPQPVYHPPIYRSPVFFPPVYRPPVFFPPAFFPTYPWYRPPYFPYSGLPGFGW